MTARTLKQSIRQRHFLSMPTTATCLRGIGRIDFDYRLASIRSFVSQDKEISL